MPVIGVHLKMAMCVGADDLRHEFGALDRNRDGFIEVVPSSVLTTMIMSGSS